MRKFLSFMILSLLCAAPLSQSVTATPVITGKVSAERVANLTSAIEWHQSLKEAREEAAKQNKLILWIHMVGKIDGAT